MSEEVYFKYKKVEGDTGCARCFGNPQYSTVIFQPKDSEASVLISGNYSSKQLKLFFKNIDEDNKQDLKKVFECYELETYITRSRIKDYFFFKIKKDLSDIAKMLSEFPDGRIDNSEEQYKKFFKLKGDFFDLSCINITPSSLDSLIANLVTNCKMNERKKTFSEITEQIEILYSNPDSTNPYRVIASPDEFYKVLATAGFPPITRTGQFVEYNVSDNEIRIVHGNSTSQQKTLEKVSGPKRIDISANMIKNAVDQTNPEVPLENSLVAYNASDLNSIFEVPTPKRKIQFE